jgi:hypothetical protein
MVSFAHLRSLSSAGRLGSDSFGLGLRTLGFTLVMLGLGSAAHAQAPADGNAGVIYEKKMIVNFGEDTIAGDLQLPDGEYIESRKRLRHSNLIKIRDSFRDKILNSVSNI